MGTRTHSSPNGDLPVSSPERNLPTSSQDGDRLVSRFFPGDPVPGGKFPWFFSKRGVVVHLIGSRHGSDSLPVSSLGRNLPTSSQDGDRLVSRFWPGDPLPGGKSLWFFSKWGIVLLLLLAEIFFSGLCIRSGPNSITVSSLGKFFLLLLQTGIILFLGSFQEILF